MSTAGVGMAQAAHAPLPPQMVPSTPFQYSRRLNEQATTDGLGGTRSIRNPTSWDVYPSVYYLLKYERKILWRNAGEIADKMRDPSQKKVGAQERAPASRKTASSTVASLGVGTCSSASGVIW